MTVSKVDPQVAIVAVPEVVGVHSNVCSRPIRELVHSPVNTAVPPNVVPMKTPPAAGIMVEIGQRDVVPQSSTHAVPPLHTICWPVVGLPGQSASVVHARL